MKIDFDQPRPDVAGAVPLIRESRGQSPLNTRLKKHAWIILRITQVWLLLLIVGSLQPARPEQAEGGALHHGIHWLAFAGTAFLLLLLSRNRRQEVRSIIAACLLGVSLEYLQHIMYRKPMEWWDVRDDILAILVIFALYHFTGARNLASTPPRRR